MEATSTAGNFLNFLAKVKKELSSGHIYI